MKHISLLFIIGLLSILWVGCQSARKAKSDPKNKIDRLGMYAWRYAHAYPTGETCFSPADVMSFAEIRITSPDELDKRLQETAIVMMGSQYTYMLISDNAERFKAITKKILAKLKEEFTNSINDVGPGINQESCFVYSYLINPQIQGTFNLYRSERKNGGFGDQFYKLVIDDDMPTWKPVKK